VNAVYICVIALPQPPADFFNLSAVSTSPDTVTSQSPASTAGPAYSMPPLPMFRPPVGMIPPHLRMGPGVPRRPPPPPPRIAGPFPPGTFLLLSQHDAAADDDELGLPDIRLARYPTISCYLVLAKILTGAG